MDPVSGHYVSCSTKIVWIRSLVTMLAAVQKSYGSGLWSLCQLQYKNRSALGSSFSHERHNTALVKQLRKPMKIYKTFSCYSHSSLFLTLKTSNKTLKQLRKTMKIHKTFSCYSCLLLTPQTQNRTCKTTWKNYEDTQNVFMLQQSPSHKSQTQNRTRKTTKN